MQDCIKRAQEGCEESFNRIVHQYSGRLYYFLQNMGLDKHDSEDIAQETFIKAYNALSNYNSHYKFSTWLFTIGRRLAISHQRKIKYHEPLDKRIDYLYLYDEDKDDTPDISIWHVAKEILKPEEYEALWLRYDQDMPVKEVATIMNTSGLYMKVILYRARKKLGQALQELQ